MIKESIQKLGWNNVLKKKSHTLNWLLKDDSVHYFLDKKSIGIGDKGFEQVMNTLKKSSVRKLIIEFEILNADGGGSIKDNFPFKNKFHLLSELAKEMDFKIEIQTIN